ncbi:Regucalcin-like protein [Thermoproteus uzoniensis 768-20]|uniref:Regucalcin-like protein n=1 Tax=Thermoproteus uzoniensis (strain 768-20) TaxID=999630 RepID=F2L1H1_THEU7|nr:SMP-30/gluconolactonase/LRE family protein [Thermoproteus uzoniensis]AEA11641.1 Regucalcin-like protein [Thermoproteus uzoniensis 768-20]
MRPVGSYKAVLGESPVYDPRTDRLYWVDIEGMYVRYLDLSTGREGGVRTPDLVTSVQLHADGELAATLRHGFYRVYLDGGIEEVALVEADMPHNRFNDGKCDAAGRYWAGTMNLDLATPTGSLYSLGLDRKVRKHLSGLAVSNGIAWSLDWKTMYLVDTPVKRIYALDFDLERGEASGARTAIDMSGEAGRPDGIAVDSEGLLWIAHARGGRISRWDPSTGEKVEEIEMPVKAVTSLTFGGPDLGVLYVTTASWSGEEWSGRVIEVEVDARGLAPSLCRF